MICLKVCLILMSALNEFETTFVSLGDYSNYINSGINGPECGQNNRKDMSITIKYNEKCFGKNYPEYKYNYSDFIYPIDKQNKAIQTRIMNGLPVEYGEAPWVVLIVEKNVFDMNYCTGVLITFQWVLTAAHCEKQFSSSNYEIYAGSKIKKKGELRYDNPLKFWQHPVYVTHKGDDNPVPRSRRYSHDIALIKLKSSFSLKMDGGAYLINTICLPKKGDHLNKNEEHATYFGWGLIGDNVYPNMLSKGEVVLVKHDKCNRNNTFCAQFDDSYRGPRGCQSDSGSPLHQYVSVDRPVGLSPNDFHHHLKAVLMGIFRGSTEIIKGDKRCTIKAINDSVFVSVPSLLDWIVDIVVNN